jgi:DNA-binding PadR family transcriptional regulator
MAREALGELEHQVMLALLQLGDDAYTAPVVQEIESRADRPVRSAAVYIALRRLEEKGLVRSRMQAPGPGGGRDRRHFEVTGEGLEQLRRARKAYLRLWEGLETVLRES